MDKRSSSHPEAGTDEVRGRAMDSDLGYWLVAWQTYPAAQWPDSASPWTAVSGRWSSHSFPYQNKRDACTLQCSQALVKFRGKSQLPTAPCASALFSFFCSVYWPSCEHWQDKSRQWSKQGCPAQEWAHHLGGPWVASAQLNNTRHTVQGLFPRAWLAPHISNGIMAVPCAQWLVYRVWMSLLKAPSCWLLGGHRSFMDTLSLWHCLCSKSNQADEGCLASGSTSKVSFYEKYISIMARETSSRAKDEASQ